ncbi:hypothetical protein ACS0TY_002189 [Phlomoides rotata]
MEEERWRLLNRAITKAKVILEGYAVNEVFSSEEYVTCYDCVYYLCHSSTNQVKLRHGFKRAMEESLVSAFPSLLGKNGVPLLREFIRLWTNYKIMSKCLRGFFQYLDRDTFDPIGAPSLSDISIYCFHDLVAKVLDQRLTNVTVILISQDRHGRLIDQNLLQCFLRYYLESGEEGKIAYCAMFEAILEDAATYYSQLATKWYPTLSWDNYVQKVEQCKVGEYERAAKYLQQPSVERLIQVVHSEMIKKYADKRTAEEVNSMVNEV